jgi:DNA/RNA endonuclease YhcR with UshA esterase domain
MNKIYLLLSGIILSASVMAQTTIKQDEMSSHIGDSVKICMKIFGGIYLDRSKGTPTLLNVGDSYPRNPLTLFIGEDIRQTFAEKPEEFFKGKDVCITGKLELYKEKIQIRIASKEQIVLQ